MEMECIAVVSINRNSAIGTAGELLYNIPEDLNRFKNITYGNDVIIGRRTYETIQNGLPGRNMIVMTRNKEFKIKDNKNVQISTSAEEAIQILEKRHCKTFYVIGGEQIYDLFKEHYSKLYITYIYDFKKGDRFFNVDLTKYKKIKEEPKEYIELKYYFQEYVRE